MIACEGLQQPWSQGRGWGRLRTIKQPEGLRQGDTLDANGRVSIFNDTTTGHETLLAPSRQVLRPAPTQPPVPHNQVRRTERLEGQPPPRAGAEGATRRLAIGLDLEEPGGLLTEKRRLPAFPRSRGRGWPPPSSNGSSLLQPVALGTSHWWASVLSVSDCLLRTYCKERICGGALSSRQPHFEA